MATVHGKLITGRPNQSSTPCPFFLPGRYASQARRPSHRRPQHGGNSLQLSTAFRSRLPRSFFLIRSTQLTKPNPTAPNPRPPNLASETGLDTINNRSEPAQPHLWSEPNPAHPALSGQPTQPVPFEQAAQPAPFAQSRTTRPLRTHPHNPPPSHKPAQPAPPPLF
ncbi:hypothetical protein BDL97_14G098600 [Sphagnum fallax]|nr:hypothetical protein BDL97_14G098600 [Sphagnum fallax]